ncbi:MAG: hypothetical protein GF418_05945 [Chitinivibrionales bacterium]|nr:hypothetical protein [Chitinivibrionales bacterium]MBD3395153.1 hypothetical protein [Chitinivibrionales bacterium]
MSRLRPSVSWILSAACFFTAAAQDIRYAVELNHVPVECRSVAMGNTGVVLPRNGTTAFWNASLPAYSTTYDIALEGAKLYGNLADLGVASLSAPVQEGLNLGALYTGFFSGDILEQDTLQGEPLERLYNPDLRATGNDATGVFTNNQHRVQVFVARLFNLPVPRPSGYSLPMPVDLAAGLNFKYFWQTMTPGDDVRMGFNVNLDFGAALSIGADYDLEAQEISRRILLGMAIRDFLPTEVVWLHSNDGYREPVDLSQYYGVSYCDKTGFLKGNWTLTFALHNSYTTSVHAGIEAEFWDLVAFRAGVSDRIPTLGAGIRTDVLYLDYAFTFDELDFSPLRLSLGFSF